MKEEKDHLTEMCRCRVIFRDGHTEVRQENLLTEYHLTMQISGTDAGIYGDDGSCGKVRSESRCESDVRVIRTVCTPQYLKELVTGRLCTEGLISSESDICRLEIDREAGTAEVELKCGSGGNAFRLPGESAEWHVGEIFELADLFGKESELHRKTGAAHSCLIACRGRLLFRCEDIGRHNALDKAVGFILQENVDPRICIAYTSGRMPEDMVRKAVRANLAALAGKASPTPSAVRLAQRCGLTLIGAARSDCMKVFCDGRA